jgi:monoterpene epsilon-lactone hydrolase
VPSRIAKLHLPVVGLLGRRLAAAETPQGVRRIVGVAGATLAPARGVRTEPLPSGPNGGRRVTPKVGAAGGRTVLMFHGGGYAFGSAKLYRGLAGRIAKAASATVDAPDYRLAPEHPHPAAVDDGLAAYRAAIERVPPRRMVVGGDSAGGGLTVAVLQAARDAGLPMPAGMFLLSPWLDLRGDPRERENAATEILILPPLVERATAWYTGEHTAEEPAISPILGSFSGLPPTLVQVSSSELLHPDSVAFVDRARAAGVDVTLEVEDGLWHAWQLMAPAVPEARASIASIGRFVVRRTG